MGVAMDAARPVLKIAVFADGRINVDGEASDIISVRAGLNRLREQNGVVWYYREAGEQEPSKQATEVIQAVIANRLPIRLSTQPDYSDAIGPDGRPIPEQ